MNQWTKTIAFGITMLILMACSSEPASSIRSIDAEDVQVVATLDSFPGTIDSPEFVATPLPTPSPTPRSNGLGQIPMDTLVSIKYEMMLTCETADSYACRELDPSQLNPEFSQNENICVAWQEDGNPPEASNLQINILQGDKQVARHETDLYGNKACRQAPIRVTGSGDYETKFAFGNKEHLLTWSISTPTPTDSPTPTSTPTPSSTPTSSPLEATAIARSEDWPLVVFDSFSENVNDWSTGDYSSERVTGNRFLTNEGKYRWEAIAHQALVWWSVPAFNTVSDFYMTVNVQRVSGTKDSRYGVVFRRDESGNYYLFEIDGEQDFRFRIRYEREWTTLVDWTSTAAIRPGDVNQLTVTAKGLQFVFLINDQRVAQAEDGRISRGKAGLAIGLSNVGDEAAFEFDNFELRTSFEEGRLFAPELVVEGRSLAREGEIDEAVAAFEQAVEYDPALEISAAAWNTLCWFGALWQQAGQVLESCEQAVALSDGNVVYRDSRGVARAMTGDIEGAIEDFEAFVQEYQVDSLVDQRQEWIDMLNAGENPFEDEALLEELRQQ